MKKVTKNRKPKERSEIEMRKLYLDEEDITIIADFESKMNEIMLEIYSDTYNPKRMMDSLTCGGF